MSIRSPEISQTPTSLISNSLDSILQYHQSDPIIMKHFNSDPIVGMRLTKMGMNKLMRQLSFGDNIQIFEDSVMLTPVKTYWEYTSDKLNMFKSKDESKLLEIYLNTCEGPMLGFAKLYNVSILRENKILEKIALVIFPTTQQTEKMQTIIRKATKEIEEEGMTGDEFRNEGESIGEEPGRKRNKNLEEWEKLLKIYFYRYRRIKKAKIEGES